MAKVFMVGAAVQAKVLAGILSEHEIPFAYDEQILPPPLPACRILHHWDEALRWAKLCDFFIVAMANEYRGKIRSELSRQMMANGLLPISAIHKSFHSNLAHLGYGLQALVNSMVLDRTHVGDWCILGNGTIVEHDCIIAEGVTVMTGANVCGHVHIDKYASIGAGATIMPALVIGEGAIVGAGAVVTKNVHAGAIVVGSPAKPLK